MESDRYTIVAIALHWLIALAIIALLAIGLTMTNIQTGMTQFRLFQLHKSIGITVLGLSVIRLIWCLTHRSPPLPANMTRFERLAARLSHWGFYGLMIGMPLTGWALVSSSPMNLPTVLFGIMPLPHLPLPKDKAISESFATLHSIGAWVMIGLLVIHIAAAVVHHFIRRDDVLHHMLPFIRTRKVSS